MPVDRPIHSFVMLVCFWWECVLIMRAEVEKHCSKTTRANCNLCGRRWFYINIAFNVSCAPQTMCCTSDVFFFIIYSCDNNCLPHKLWSIASAQCDTVWPGKAKFYQTQRLSVKAPCSEWVSAEVKCVSAEGNDRTGFAAHTETKTTDYRSKGSQSGLKHRGVSHRVEWAEDYCLCSTGGEPRALAENLTETSCSATFARYCRGEHEFPAWWARVWFQLYVWVQPRCAGWGQIGWVFISKDLLSWLYVVLHAVSIWAFL